MKVRYKGEYPMTVWKADFSIYFSPGEEKEIPDDIGNDLLNNPFFEKVETKSKFLKNEGGE